MAGPVPATHDRKSLVCWGKAAAAHLSPHAVFMGGRDKPGHDETTKFQFVD
jgi:hypothetical protein